MSVENIPIEEILRRYKAQRAAAAAAMLQAGMSQNQVGAWQERTARPESEITAPFTPNARALREEQMRRAALDRLAQKGR